MATARGLFKKLKQAHDDSDALDRKTLIKLLDKLTEQEEAHPAEEEFENLLGLNKAQEDQQDDKHNGADATSHTEGEEAPPAEPATTTRPRTR
jgi:hypothetical protein